MKYFMIPVFLLLLAGGCKPGIPKELIQPDKMALVLHDIHLFDGYIGTVTNIDSAKVVAAGYYKGIYQKYGVDSAVYNKSLAYYNAHPKAMEAIYKQLTERLKKEKEVYVKADSLENVKRRKAMLSKARQDSVRRADSVKVAAEKLKLKKQLDSLKKLQKPARSKRPVPTKKVSDQKSIKK